MFAAAAKGVPKPAAMLVLLVQQVVALLQREVFVVW
jgi:hypothetical protein